MTQDEAPHDAQEVSEVTDEERVYLLGQFFSPRSPINSRELFAGREGQVSQLLDAIGQQGTHAVLFGERGVGKTSLATVIVEILQAVMGESSCPKANCDSTDTFTTMWRKVFNRIAMVEERVSAGFASDVVRSVRRLGDDIGGDISPEAVREALTAVGKKIPLVIFFDEYDRAPESVSTAMADTIKTLSDESVPATVVLVGVADNVEELVREHRSVERAVVQIRMPRMSDAEVEEIMRNALGKVGMRIEPAALGRIVAISRGLPHYTHLVGLDSARVAARRHSAVVGEADVDRGIELAVESANESIRVACVQAVDSRHPAARLRETLTAAALARTDERGYFRAAHVQGPLADIRGRPVAIAQITPHLDAFTTPGRGSVIEKSGPRHNVTWRFANPLLQPYVLMDGIKRGLISKDQLLSFGAQS